MASRFKNMLGDMSTYALNNVAIKLIALAALPIITRVFSVEDYGVVDTIQSSVALLPTIVGLGYDVAVMKQLLLEKDKGKQRDATFTLAAFLAAWGGAIIGACLIFSNELAFYILGSVEHGRALFLALLSIYSNIFFGLALQLMRVEFKVRQYAVVNVTQSLAQYALIVVSIAILDWGVTGYFSASLVVNVVWTVVASFLMRDYYVGRFDRAVLKTLLKVGAPVMVSSLAYWVMNFSDRIILTNLVSATQTGYYSMSVKLISLTTLMILAFSKAWVPRAFQFFRESPSGYPDIMKRVHPILAFVLSLVALANVAVARPLLLVFATEDFLPALPIVVPLAFAGVFQGLSTFSSMGIYFKDRTVDIARASWAAAVMNVLVNVALMPTFGAIIGGVSTLVSYVFLYLYYRRKTCRYLEFRESLVKPLATVSLALLFAALMSVLHVDNLLLDVALKLAMCLVYCVGGFLLRIVGCTELKGMAASLLRKQG